MENSFKVIRISDMPIGVHPSWFLIFGLFNLLAGNQPDARGIPAAQQWNALGVGISHQPGILPLCAGT